MKYEEYINDEYNRAKVRYEALKLLKEGGVSPEPTPTPTPTPAPTPTPTPTPTPEPISKDPEIVYTGDANITLAPGEHRKFSVYVNNVSSSHDYVINTTGDPTYMGCNEAGYKTSSGYRIDFDIWGVNRGNGTVTVFLAKDKSRIVNIAVAVR
jgi:hypothetical protein